MRREQNKGRQDIEAVNQKSKEVRSLIESMRLRVQILDLKAVILGGAFILFHAVIYGQQENPSSTITPENLWVRASILAAASLAFWPAFIDTVDNCMRTRQQQESSFIEREKSYRKMSSQQHSRRDDSAAAAQSLALGFASVRRRRHAYVGTLYFALLCFTLSVSSRLSGQSSAEFKADPTKGEEAN